MGNTRPTIFALSSGRPPAAIAVVRISGPAARLALETMTGKVPEPRRATLVKVREGGSGEVIDEGLALWFPAPKSETGEDMAELQVHGGRAVIEAILRSLSRLEGCRLAEPGEFTRRAFENGRMDLTAVEGLADLIYAETEAQRRQAIRHLQGYLGNRAEDWRTRLIEALALVEAGIDFSDEGDVPRDLVQPALAIARGLREEILGALADERRGERLRDGLAVAIAGPPNAGKSSLLNRLARREAAIVSPFAGTTRDVIEVHFDLAGYPVTLLDTAGIRDVVDPVEQEGVRRARERAAAADLVLWVVDASEPLMGQARPLAHGGARLWMVHNKVDLLAGQAADAAQRCRTSEREPSFRVSAKTGAGIEELMAALTDFAGRTLSASEPALVTRERHRQALADAVAALDRALESGVQYGEEIFAEELRLASRALGRLTGRVDVEDVLDVIFREFCIGK